jgi:thiol-disulfide isomerase/thioredoxin
MFRDDLAPAVAAAVLLVGIGAPGARAQESKGTPPPVTLKLGDTAPPLSVEKWLKGAPVAAFERGRAYVVEFWATWCPPCIKSMPHLSELQRKYGERATIIGVTSTDPRNRLDAVEALVAAKGDAIAYTVAWDVERATTDAYRTASGWQGIPCSFLVDGEGKLAWIGHPMWLDEPLAAVVAGTWDLETGNARMAKVEETYQSIYAHIAKDPRRSLELLAGFERDYASYAHLVQSVKFDALLSAGRYEEAYAQGARVVDAAIAEKDAYGLNAIAWRIVDPNGKVEQRDLALALRAAERASAFTDDANGAILDTLARVHFLSGDLEKALELQRKAVSCAEGRMKESLEEVLREYEKARLE